MLRGKEIYPMSSGEKQKIAVASVNAVDPEIYVFDEPSANLDMYSVEALKNLMSALKAEGHTIIVAEHRLYYLTDLADRFLYMENGSIKEEWTAQELLSIPEGKRRAIGIRAADLHHIEVDIPPAKEKKYDDGSKGFDVFLSQTSGFPQYIFSGVCWRPDCDCRP